MQKEFEDLKGKWALILGASSGFGGTTAVRLAQAGMNICGVHLDRRATLENAEKIVTDIKACGREALFFNVNASDAEKRKEVLAGFKAHTSKKFHILFHSLAFGALKPYFEEDGLTQPQMEMTLDVMAHSLVYWSQDLVKESLLGSGAKIYAMTSAGGERVWKSYGAVSAAKAALESHIRQLSLELAPKNISANSIRAGVTDTPALRKIPGNEEMIVLAAKKNPHKRLTTPQDIADAVVALSLPHMNWLTGNVLGIDGGENVVE